MKKKNNGPLLPGEYPFEFGCVHSFCPRSQKNLFLPVYLTMPGRGISITPRDSAALGTVWDCEWLDRGPLPRFSRAIAIPGSEYPRSRSEVDHFQRLVVPAKPGCTVVEVKWIRIPILAALLFPSLEL